MSSFFKAALLATATVSILSVGACKPADKGQGALKSEGIAALGLDRADASTFGKYFQTTDCEADEMEMLGALAGLGLGEDGDAGVSFAAREVAGSTVTYRDLRVAKDDAEVFSAESALFHCPKMLDAGASFDRLDLENATARENDLAFTFETLNVADPTPKAAAQLVDGMTGARRSASDEDVGFGAITLTGATMSGENITGRLSALAWGEADGKTDFMLEDLELASDEDAGRGFSVKMEGASLLGLRSGGPGVGADTLGNPLGALGLSVGRFNSAAAPYESFVVGQVDMESQIFDMDFAGIEGQSETKGSVTTTRAAMKPLVLTPKPSMAESPQFADAYRMLQTLGYETLRLSGSSVTLRDTSDDSLRVEDGRLQLDDGFVLNFEYGLDGIAALQTALAETPSGGRDMPDAVDDLNLRNLRLTLEDNSIVERGLRLASDMTGQSEKALKRSLSLAVFGAAMAAENDIQAEVYSKATQAAVEFVKKGGTLTIEANPPAPFPLAPLLLGEAGEIDPATLGFSASQDSP